MASSTVEIFNTWLSEKLLKLNNDVDLDVFVSYITGILETETTFDDRNESLVGIIGEILQDDSITEHCSEIISKWTELIESSSEVTGQQDTSSFDTAILNIIEKQTAQANVTKSQSRDADQQKKAILAQYANVSDGEDSDDATAVSHKQSAASSSKASTVAAAAASSGADDLLVKNMNALKVKERERMEREHAKQQSETKRQKDKEDREKQKQKTQDRKDNEKKRTQKGEKKR